MKAVVSANSFFVMKRYGLANDIIENSGGMIFWIFKTSVLCMHALDHGIIQQIEA